MRRRVTFLTSAFALLLTTSASAEGVIAGQAAEIRRIERKLVGSSQYITVSDGRTVKASPETVSVLVATQLIAPDAIVALPEHDVVGAPDGTALGAPVIAYPVARGVDAVPVVVIDRQRAVAVGTTTSVFPAGEITLGAVQPGTPIAVVGGDPILLQEGYYSYGAVADRPVLRSFRLTNGQWITISDRVQRPMAIEGDVAFDPAALRPGAYVRIVRRDDGSYFLGTASAPRDRYPGVPAGKVTRVDGRAEVIELNDGSFVHPVPGESAILAVGDQAIQPAALKPGQWLVIDPGPTMTVETPSAIPADTVAAGRVMVIR